MMEEARTNETKEAPGWLIDNIAEASINARKAYFVYIAFLNYCIFSILGSSDKDIILNNEIILPFIDQPIPLKGFFIFAPLAALLLFVYLQLYIFLIKRLKDDLKQYSPIDKRRLYPWILAIAENTEPSPIGILQKVLFKISFWWSLPLVLALFSLWFIKRHDPILSYILCSMPIAGSIIVIFFWCQYENDIEFSKFKFTDYLSLIWQDRLKLCLVLTIVGLEVFAFIGILPWTNVKKFFIQNVGFYYVDLSHEKLSNKPSGDQPDDSFWLDLRNVRLEGARLVSSFLKKANLMEGNFTGADLSEADLSDADLTDAYLERAKFINTTLNNSILISTKLSGSEFRDAKLRNVDLANAELHHTDFGQSDLTEAKLVGAQLFDAKLQLVRLNKADLSNAKLNNANLRQAVLIGANLSGADLSKANLSEATFSGANFSGADLSGAIFIEADLREAKSLTIEQLAKVATLYKAKLDTDLGKEIEIKYSHLFEKPDGDE